MTRGVGDTPNPQHGAPDGHGRYGILDHNEGSVRCHECGQWWDHLASHLFKAHGIRATDYRRAHGLPLTLPLVGTRAQKAMATSWERNATANRAALQDRQQAAARRSVVTPEQVEALGDPADLPAWCRAVRSLIAEHGVSMAGISRACGLSVTTVATRLRRHPA